MRADSRQLALYILSRPQEDICQPQQTILWQLVLYGAMVQTPEYWVYFMLLVDSAQVAELDCLGLLQCSIKFRA